MRLKEWLWSLLPDTCEVSGCCRKGVRGNEVVTTPWPERYPDIRIVMCDYCNSKYMSGEVLKVDGLLPYLTRGNKVMLFDEALRRKRREREG